MIPQIQDFVTLCSKLGLPMLAKTMDLFSERERGPHSPRAFAQSFAPITTAAVLGIIPMLGLAVPPAGPNSLQESPHLATLQVEIWPEFDRPDVLVLLRGELAADAKLPAAMSLPIPGSSHGPTAVAFAGTSDGELFNLKYDYHPGADYGTVRFELPQRYFHIEFYDPIVIGTPQRRYNYTWSSGLAADSVTVRVQEPARATDISVQPALGKGLAGPNNLLYRQANIGALKAGTPLPIEIRYTKADSRTSAEILGMGAAASQTTAAAEDAEKIPIWLLAVAIALVVGTVIGTVIVWWWRRKKAIAAPRTHASFCAQCGNELGSGDCFCSKCGAVVRKS